jgi:hypothetical protein
MRAEESCPVASNIAQWWPVFTLGALAVTAVVKIISLRLALRDTKPADRAEIITALAELFRSWRLK